VLAAGLDPDRRQELAAAWASFFDTEYGAPGGGIGHNREYLIVGGTRR